MKISVYRPKFTEEFKKNALISRNKGASVSLSTNQDLTVVVCFAYGRLVGTMNIIKDGDEARVVYRHIIEKDFYPWEAMISKLLPSLRRRKVKRLII